jgi:hypothetical protein
MSFKYKKAIIIGLLYYAIALIVDVFGNSFVSGYFLIMMYVWWLVSTIAIFLLTRYYYFRQKPKNPLSEGLLLGILLVVITLIMEITLVVYGLGMGWEIYQFWIIWIQYPLVLISPIIAALTK